MTVATQGAGTQFLLPQLGINVGAKSALGAAINAGVSALASRATVSLINNKGDLGKVFKELGSSQFVKSLATSMLTAGLTAGLTPDPVAMQQASLSSNAFNALPFVERLQDNLVNSLVSTSVETAIQGGDFGDNLLNNLRNVGVNQLLAVTDKYVGDLTDGQNKLPVANLIAHTVVGGLAAEATGGKFVAGAAAGLASAVAAQSGVFKGMSPTDIARVSQLIGGAAALLAGGGAKDVNQGAATSQSAALNNYLTHRQLEEADAIQRELLSCEFSLFATCSKEKMAELRAKVEEYKLLSATQTAKMLLECQAGGPNCASMLNDAEQFTAQAAKDRRARIGLGGMGYPAFAAPGADDFYVSVGEIQNLTTGIGVGGLNTPVDVDAIAVSYFRQALDPKSGVSFAQASTMVQNAVLRSDSNYKLFVGGLQVVGGVAAGGSCASTGGLTCLALGMLGGTNVVLGGNRVKQGLDQYLANEAQKSGIEKGLIKLGYSEADAKRYLENTELLVGIADMTVGGVLTLKGASGLRVRVTNSGSLEFGSKAEINATAARNTVAAVDAAAKEGLVKVYRVEGAPNTRIVINDNGSVSVVGETMLFLNFGDEARALQYVQQKLNKGLPDPQLKSFDVPQSFVDDMVRSSVDETLASSFPGRPLRVDITKGVNQLGLRDVQIRELENAIVQGSGTTSGIVQGPPVPTTPKP